MPKVRFSRTPTDAEAGPDHKFVAGGVYDMTDRQAERWERRGAAEVVPYVVDAAPVDAPVPEPVESDEELAQNEPPPHQNESGALYDAPGINDDPMAAAREEYMVPHRTIRHAGHGKWHVYEGYRQLTDMPLPKGDAEALAEAGQ